MHLTMRIDGNHHLRRLYAVAAMPFSNVLAHWQRYPMDSMIFHNRLVLCVVWPVHFVLNLDLALDLNLYLMNAVARRLNLYVMDSIVQNLLAVLAAAVAAMMMLMSTSIDCHSFSY